MRRWAIIGLCLFLTITISQTMPGNSHADDSPSSAQSDQHVSANENYKNEMELMMHNGKLAFYMNKATVEFMVEHVESGDLWYSNPPDREQDELAEPFVKGVLGSQLSISYYNLKGQPGKMYTWNDSVSKNQHTVEADDDVVKVSYTLGDLSEQFVAPKRFVKARFEEILTLITEESKQSEFKNAYRFIESENVFEQWMNNTNKKKEALLEILVSIGYTQEDFIKDSQDSGVEIKEKVSFHLSIEYRLDGDQLVVTVPVSEMNPNDDYPINKISVLDFFGAAGKHEEGYSFVPDGSGALIYHNAVKPGAQPFQKHVYGTDATIVSTSRQLQSETIRMPVFGMKHQDKALFAVIEKGDAIAEIVADTSGRGHSFNTVHSTYTVANKDEIKLTGSYESNTINVFQSEMYADDIIIRYGFLPDEQASYAGMAQYYRQYLVETHHLSRLDDGERPFILELSGAIPKRTSWLGIPYEKTEALTTFDQATAIVDQLLEAKVTRIKLRYSGWFNGGMRQTTPTSVSPTKPLGGKKGWQQFIRAMDDREVQVYPDVSFAKVYRGGIFDFGVKSRTSMMINRKRAIVYPQHLAAELRTDGEPSYVMKPVALPGVVQKFIPSYAAYGLEALSLADLADVIGSDFKVSASVNRQQALSVYKEQAAVLSASFPNVMVEGGNMPMLPYFQTVVHAPLESSGYMITDESVPFYSMVLHGYVDIAGMPVNETPDGDWRRYFLKALESGANVYAHWMFSPADTTKDTDYDHLNSHHYEDWLDESIRMYEEFNSAMSGTRSRLIVDHEQILDGVYRTTFEGGKTITVNYNKSPIEVQGITIAAQSYHVGGE